MDFDQADCQGNDHHLFSELDAGKVVILEYVMLNCTPCIVATNALEELIAPYELSHPGRVVIFSFGFLNQYNCDQLNAWRTSNQFDHPVFAQGEEQVNYYGGMGMPTIVVTGTNEHNVFYKGIGYTSSQNPSIIAAIDNALLYNPTGIGDPVNDIGFSIYPTVFSDHLYYSFDDFSGSLKLVITDLSGRTLLEETVENTRGAVFTGDLPAGSYIATLTGSGKAFNPVKLIKNK